MELERYQADNSETAFQQKLSLRAASTCTVLGKSGSGCEGRRVRPPWQKPPSHRRDLRTPRQVQEIDEGQAERERRRGRGLGGAEAAEFPQSSCPPMALKAQHTISELRKKLLRGRDLLPRLGRRLRGDGLARPLRHISSSWADAAAAGCV